MPSPIRILQQDIFDAVHVILAQPLNHWIDAKFVLTGAKVNETLSVLVLVFVSLVGLVVLESRVERDSDLKSMAGEILADKCSSRFTLLGSWLVGLRGQVHLLYTPNSSLGIQDWESLLQPQAAHGFGPHEVDHYGIRLFSWSSCSQMAPGCLLLLQGAPVREVILHRLL